MRTIKNITKEIRETSDVKGMIEVYEELAAATMSKIRKDIISARLFFEDLAKVSTEVGADLSLGCGANRGNVAVFMSAQSGLFGDIIDKVFADFVDFIRKNKVDVAVAGKVGKTLMNTICPEISFDYFDLADDKYDDEQMSEIMGKIGKYKQIYLFHGQFISIVTQKTWTTPISGQVLQETQGKIDPQNKFTYIYEPSVDKVAEIFSKEIMAAIFNNSLKESQLAKYASRLMYLDDSIERIGEKLGQLFFEKIDAAKRAGARRQLITVSGIFARKNLS